MSLNISLKRFFVILKKVLKNTLLKKIKKKSKVFQFFLNSTKNYKKKLPQKNSL
jgi:hypothetical protein